MRKRLSAALLVLLLLIAAGCGSALAGSGLEVHYIDVGQAESTLLRTADFAILIDAGDQKGTQVLDYLRRLGVDTIDLLVLTHPHADHIGQAAEIVRELKVKEVWMSGYEHTTTLFEGLLDAVLDSDAAYFEPRTGGEEHFGDLTLQVLNPVRLSSNLHETCIVLRAIYGEVSFLFTGDAESSSERAMLREGLEVQARILQLGHHGSRTSSSLEFLLAVDPDLVIYSAGVGNDYGHPHQEVIDRLKILGIPSFGTEQFGTIVVKTDGMRYELETSRPGSLSQRCVDLNTASFEELQEIIHIGPERALQIVEERTVRPFRSVDELRHRIEGIGENRLQDIKAQGLACVKGVTDD